MKKADLEEAKKRKGLCDYCLAQPAVKKHKTCDGHRVNLCVECYEKETGKKP